MSGISKARRIILALAVSVLLHLALLLAPAPPLPTPEVSPPLVARLEPLPPPPPRSAVPKAKKPRPVPKRSPARPPTEPSPAAAEPAPPAPAQDAPQPAPAGTDTTAAQAATAPAKEVRALPARIEIRYALVKGEQGLEVGRMTHRWESGEDGYTLTSLARATGLFSLFLPGTLIQVSRGELTPEGLRPALFWIQRGQSGDRTESASFDWATATLRFGKPGQERSVPLESGTQDVLSVLYQLALTAPHAGMLDLPVTNGRKFDHYRYRVVGEETLATPLGELVTERLERVREAGEDGLEIWLARDYHYLPVRLRFVDRKGDVAEQVVTEIRAQ